MRLLCGYLQCDALDFRPLRNALPTLLHVGTRAAKDGDWLRATIDQIVSEVDRPRAGGLSMLERLTEIIFIELLRHQIIAAKSRRGRLARCAGRSGAGAMPRHDPRRSAARVVGVGACGGLRALPQHLAERFESDARHLADALCARLAALSRERRAEHERPRHRGDRRSTPAMAPRRRSTAPSRVPTALRPPLGGSSTKAIGPLEFAILLKPQSLRLLNCGSIHAPSPPRQFRTLSRRPRRLR